MKPAVFNVTAAALLILVVLLALFTAAQAIAAPAG